jgi:hypothetical protein
VTPKVALQAALGSISYSWAKDVDDNTIASGVNAIVGLSSFSLGAAVFF